MQVAEEQSATIEIREIHMLEPLAESLVGASVDDPVPGVQFDGYSFRTHGWILGRADAVVQVGIDFEGTTLRTTPVDRSRLDVAEAFAAEEAISWAPTSGFMIVVGTLGLPPEFTVTLFAVLATNEHVPFAIIRGRHTPLRVPGAFRPLLVTCLGRSGSTLIMQMLASHPRIVAERSYPYETTFANYWLYALKSLSEADDTFDPSAWAMYSGAPHDLKANPILHYDYPHDPPVLQWLQRDHVEHLAVFCRQSIDAFYTRVATTQEQSAPIYFAEKFRPSIIPDMCHELMPESREIFSVRDFRDLFCSVVAFLAKHQRQLADYEGSIDPMALLDGLVDEATRLQKNLQRRASTAQLVRYEDLIAAPFDTLERILLWLGLDCTPSLVQKIVQNTFSETVLSRDHRTTPTAAASIGRWKRDLSPELQKACEATLGDLLAAFGYR